MNAEKIEESWRKEVSATIQNVKEEVRKLRRKVHPRRVGPQRAVVLPGKCLELMRQLEGELFSWKEEVLVEASTSVLRRTQRFFNLAPGGDYSGMEESASSKEVIDKMNSVNLRRDLCMLLSLEFIGIQESIRQ